MNYDPPLITIDCETQSRADLTRVGSYAYAQHPSTRVVCVCWGVGDEPVQSWSPLRGDPPPLELWRLIEGGALLEAHHAAFEYAIFHCILAPRHGWPLPRLRQWRDTMATACYYAMPAALDRLLRALDMPGKDSTGARLIDRYSKLHNKNTFERIPDGDPEQDWVSWTKMLAWEKELFPEAREIRGMVRDHLRLFISYCCDDVVAEQDVGDELGELPEEELENFFFDLETNARGLCLDERGIAQAVEIVSARHQQYTENFRDLTGFGPNQRDKVMGWFREQGVELENMQAEYLEGLLEQPETDEAPVDGERAPSLPKIARDAIRLRLALNKASTSKLEAMLRQRSDDGRARFQTRYHGAVSGRNTGGGFQPLNLVRSWEPKDAEDPRMPERLVQQIEIAARHQDPDWLDALYGDAMDAVSHALRHYIVAAEGHDLMAGDLSSIEAVLNAVLSGEQWKIDLFRDGGDPYVAFASRALGRTVRGKKDPDVTEQDLLDRQRVGKPGELAFGYQGSVGAWRKFDHTDTFDDEQVLAFVRAWREQHVCIKGHWGDMNDASKEATLHPGRDVEVSEFTSFRVIDEWLSMRLADGKRIWYRDPKVLMRWPAWHKPKEPETHPECAAGTCDHERVPTLTYMTAKGKKWFRTSTYGGKLVENEVQATSRQLLMPRARRLRDAGYRPILTVYDEVVCEVPEGQGSIEEFHEIMSEPQPWNETWPVRCDTPWRAKRYRK